MGASMCTASADFCSESCGSARKHTSRALRDHCQSKPPDPSGSEEGSCVQCPYDFHNNHQDHLLACAVGQPFEPVEIAAACEPEDSRVEADERSKIEKDTSVALEELAQKEPFREESAKAFLFNWEAYLPGFAKPKACADLADSLQRYHVHVGYSNCAGPGVLWAYAGLGLLWTSFVIFGILAVNTARGCQEDGEIRVPNYLLYPFFLVIFLCAWIENRAMNYTAIPRAQLIPRGDDGFKLLGCSASYRLWLVVMQVISLFKRMDFAMDVFFMSELYLSTVCDSSEIHAFFDAHMDGLLWQDLGTTWVVRLFVFLYFPRLLFALLAATPLIFNPKIYQVPSVTAGDNLHAVTEALDQLRTTESVVDLGGRPAHDDVRTVAQHLMYGTCLNSHADHRFVLTLVAEVGSMASITLEDLKYSQRLQQYMQQYISSGSAPEQCYILWLCLRDVRTQLLRAFLSIFLSGFFENCIQLNLQVLLLSMATVYGDSHKRSALISSIVSSFIVCILKLDQTRKVMQYARGACSRLDRISKGVDIAGMADTHMYEQFKNDLWKVRRRSVPVLVMAILLFVAAVAYAGMRFVFVHICDSSMWQMRGGCVDGTTLKVAIPD